MKKSIEEPMCRDKSFERHCKFDDEAIKNNISELLESESFAVLSTQGKGQPYASIIGYSSTPDLKNIVFATSKETRKFSLITESRKVALLVDNRSSVPPIINKICAVTITGQSHILEEATDQGKWADLLVKKHPYLKEFVQAPSTAVILVDVYRYFYVRRFQEVFEWNPHQR
ncbi:MAG: pyridoxamine 5'-phosphate oxidase family protein [Methanobacteriaceae archaeon]|nr:pyridoxamine 5'-phosphate oxidase family protein [Methanobacteriaceae archaeon]